MSQLTHINAAGEAHMVDVSAKAETVREARAEAFVTMRSETLAMIWVSCDILISSNVDGNYTDAYGHPAAAR